MVMFLLQCPRCKQRMKYQTRTRILTGKRKTCVYCGKSYGVHDAIIKELVDR